MKQILCILFVLGLSSQSLLAQEKPKSELAASFTTGLYEARNAVGDGSGIKLSYRTFFKNPKFQLERNFLIANQRNGFANGVRIEEFAAITAQVVVNYDFARLGPVRFGLYAGPSISTAQGTRRRGAIGTNGGFEIREIKTNEFYAALGFGLQLRVGDYDSKYGLMIAVPNTQLGTGDLYELTFSAGVWIKL